MTRKEMLNKVIAKYGEDARITKIFAETCERTPERFEYVVKNMYLEICFGIQW